VPLFPVEVEAIVTSQCTAERMLPICALVMGLAGRITGTCRHIALVHSLHRAVAPLLRSIGHTGWGSSVGLGWQIVGWLKGYPSLVTCCNVD
jgi:hypothetical protein